MDEKTILVTGGAGFIGSYVNKQLNEAGYRTVVLDNLSNGDRRAATRGAFVEGDIATDAEAVLKEFSVNAVMHFAAYIDVGDSVKDPAKYYANNVIGTFKLLEAMRRQKVEKIVFSSSAAVYGMPQEEPITEAHPTLPINPYGETKLMIEKILRDYFKAYGIGSVSLRYFNAAGGDPDGEVLKYGRKDSNLIPLALSSLLKEQGSVTIFGTDYPTPDGTCLRDYIHIDDLGAAHLLALEKLFEAPCCSRYNLGNGQGFSVRQVLQTVKRVTGNELNIIEGARREGDPATLIASSKKAEEELGWRQRRPELEKMIADAWNTIYDKPQNPVK